MPPDEAIGARVSIDTYCHRASTGLKVKDLMRRRSLDDALRQIALADGPRILGWSTWRASRADPDALAHLISGALKTAPRRTSGTLNRFVREVVGPPRVIVAREIDRATLRPGSGAGCYPK